MALYKCTLGAPYLLCLGVHLVYHTCIIIISLHFSIHLFESPSMYLVIVLETHSPIIIIIGFLLSLSTRQFYSKIQW